MAGKRKAPLVRPKSMFASSRKAWESIAKQSGLRPTQVTAAHTAKAWVWKRKATAKAPTKAKAAPKKRKSGAKPKGRPKAKTGGKRKMTNTRQTFVEPEAVGYGIVAGAIGSLFSRFVPENMAGLAEGAALIGTGAMTPKGGAGDRTKSTLQTLGGVTFGDNLAGFVPVPQMGRGNGNGNQTNRQFL